MEDILKSLLQVRQTAINKNRRQDSWKHNIRTSQSNRRRINFYWHKLHSGLKGGTPPIRPSHVLQKMTADDMEAYLLPFERAVERESWPKAWCASIVAPFLVGDTQKAYCNLESAAAEGYGRPKAEILARASVTSTMRAQQFHKWQYQEGQAPRSQMFDLIHLAQRWHEPELNSSARIVEILVLDHFLSGLPPMLRKWVGQSDPTNVDEFVALVERQLTAEELTCAPYSGPSRSNW